MAYYTRLFFILLGPLPDIRYPIGNLKFYYLITIFLYDNINLTFSAPVFLQKKKGDFSGWIGYTLSWNFRQFDDLNEGNVFPFRYDRRHDISVVGIYKLNDRIYLICSKDFVSWISSLFPWIQSFFYFNPRYKWDFSRDFTWALSEHGSAVWFVKGFMR